MKRRKLRYIPGLISIIGLPILLFFFGPEDRIQPTSLRMYLPTDKKDSPGLIRFSKESFYLSVIKNKKIITIDLDEYRYDEITNYRFYRKLNFVSREIERLQFTNDTSTILKIQLGDENTYGDFIWVYNLALLYRVKRYIFVDNSIYFLTNPPAIHYPPMDLTIDSSSIVEIPQKSIPTKWDIFKRRMEERLREAFFEIRHSYVIIIGFVLLIILPGIIRIKKNFHPEYQSR